MRTYSTNNKCERGCGEKRTLLSCRSEWKLVNKPTVENSMEVPYKTKNSYRMIQQSHSGILSSQNYNSRDTLIPMFIAALFTMAKTWKQPKCPSADEWINKTPIYAHIYVYIIGTYNIHTIYTPYIIYTVEYYSTIKRMK